MISTPIKNLHRLDIKCDDQTEVKLFIYILQSQIENETIKKKCIYILFSGDELLATIQPEIEIQLGDMEIKFEATNNTLEQPDNEIKLEQGGSMQVVANPTDFNEDIMIIC